MKITLNWLKQYVEFSWSPEELAERLTMLGLEVESVRKLSGEFDGVVVAQILSSDKHPNADKLSVCRVADGQGERQIVCGAKNYAVGDKVPLILPGHTLPARPGEAAVQIRAGKIRGIESQGMLCSPKELGLTEDAQGLMILPADARIGQPFAEHLGRASGDVVYDLEITPNRPDLNSVIGIAREVGAVLGRSVAWPAVAEAPSQGNATTPAADAYAAVRVEDVDLCPRYILRVVRGVKVGPSPEWLRSALEKVGVRSINNVVDVTNYVMLEVGQPLHAFDLRLLETSKAGERPTVIVRRAAPGEKFTTLDGQERTLTPEMLLIADEKKAIALAGVMGGQNTEINPATADVLIETAHFKPQNIRATSKKLELRSESSYRFERGVDLEMAEWASRRAADLIRQTAGGEIVPAKVESFPRKPAAVEIPLRHEKVSGLLGVEVPVQEQIQYLQRLELKLVTPESRETNRFLAPSFRPDLKREVDLIEEIVRLYGVDRVPSSPPRGAIGANAYDTVHDELAEARRILTALGVTEAQGQTLISETAGRAWTDPNGLALVRLSNPLSSDMNVLRPSLLPGLLDSLRHNVHHRTSDVALFELGRVFGEREGAVREERRLALALTGARHAPFWTGEDRLANYDIFDLKGLLEEFLDQLGVLGATWIRAAAGDPIYLESALVKLGNLTLGRVGQLQPVLARTYDLRNAVLIAEFDLDQLLARRRTSKGFKTLPQFPAIERDMALLLPEETPHEAVLAAVRQAKVPHLERVQLFDVYRGQNVPAGRKSVAYSFTYRNPERTLLDSEVNTAHARLVEVLREKLNAAVRE